MQAVLAIEDHRFYQHGALDVHGTVRALVRNAVSGGVVEGGSSITQQLVKQTLVHQADGPAERRAATQETFARKLRELTYAIGLEKRRSKDWILERYLNTVYFGDGAYGIQAAAEHYYGVDARSLDLNQAATLAGLVQNPTAYDPTDHPARARARRDVVLDRMAELGVVRPHRAARVQRRGLALDPRRTPNGCVASDAPFFCDYALEFLYADRRLGATREERQELVRTGGLTIRTTLDVGWQQAADSAVAERTDPTDRAIGALAMTEPGTGEVRALAQSRPMGADRRAGETFLNHVVPTQYGDSAGFQAGSTFKTFVLAAAIEQGIPAGHHLCHARRGGLRPGRLRQLSRRCSVQRDVLGRQRRGALVRPREPLLRHASVHQHLHPPPRAGDRRLRAVRAGAPDGRPPDGARRRRDDRTRAGADLPARRGERESSRDGRGLRDLRRPRRALRLATGHHRARPEWADRAGARAPVRARHACLDRRRRQRRAPRRARTGRPRRGAGTGPARRREDRQQRGPVGLVRGLHP
ncbi:transglycosylase domain-containing protein [Nocardioides sp. TF02-7]|nr:transglycosylase domain-containing protein [Nocardioides sp. TF02-7]